MGFGSGFITPFPLNISRTPLNLQNWEVYHNPWFANDSADGTQPMHGRQSIWF